MGVVVRMLGLRQVAPYLLIAGQIGIFLRVENQWLQAALLAFVAFQLWQKYDLKREGGS